MGQGGGVSGGGGRCGKPSLTRVCVGKVSIARHGTCAGPQGPHVPVTTTAWTRASGRHGRWHSASRPDARRPRAYPTVPSGLLGTLGGKEEKGRIVVILGDPALAKCGSDFSKPLCCKELSLRVPNSFVTMPSRPWSPCLCFPATIAIYLSISMPGLI